MIYIIQNKKDLYICSNEYKQTIFDFHGTLGLSERLEKDEIKQLKKKKTFAKLENHVLKKNIPITLCDSEGRLRISNSSGVSITETENPLELLARHATDHTQLGLVTDKGTKVLYGRDLRLKQIPDYFKGFFGTSGSRVELSHKIHEVLIDYLQNFDYKHAEKLIRTYTKLDFDSFISKQLFTFFNLRKRNKPKKDKKQLGRVLVNNSRQTHAAEILYTIKTALSLPAFSYKNIPFIDVRCPKKDEKKVEKELKQQFDASIAKIIKLPKIKTKNDVLTKYRNLMQIGAYDAQKTTKGQGVNVAVIDTGIDYNHEQLKNRFSSLKGYDFLHETATPQDDNGHGSHVAGIIAADELGVAPQCNLFALKVLDARGYGNEADILAAIDWAIENDMHVLNMSLGSNYASNAEHSAINAALQQGIIIAAAAGNDGNTSYTYPASYQGVLSIAAVDYMNNHSWFSNKNDRLFISAPGEDIFSCYKNNKYKELSGTSMATPHIAGTLALLLSIEQEAHLEEVLEATAQELSAGQDARLYGAGLVRADKAVASILQPT